MKVFALYDRKLKEYGQLVQANNREAVKRGLSDGVRGSGSLVEKHPEDFDLYELGEFNADSGVLSACDVPLCVENVAVILNGNGGV